MPEDPRAGDDWPEQFRLPERPDRESRRADPRELPPLPPLPARRPLSSRRSESPLGARDPREPRDADAPAARLPREEREERERPSRTRFAEGDDRDRPFRSRVLFDDLDDDDFGDDGEPPRRRGFGSGDRSLRWVALAIVALAALIAVLVLPPVRALDRIPSRSTQDAGVGGITTRARNDLPALPAGLTALSLLYDIEVADNLVGPFSLTVRLREQVTDGTNLAFYTYDGGRWQRVASVTPIGDGRSAQGQVDEVPHNIAVLRRTSFARALNLVVGPGETPAKGAPKAGILSVLAGEPVADRTAAEVGVDYRPDALRAAQQQGGTVYLGIAAAGGDAADAVNRMLATPQSITAHIHAVAAAADGADAAGIEIAYTAVDPARRAAFTSFIEQLAAELGQRSRRLVVAVPAPNGADTGAYDWPALNRVAEALWLRGPDDPAAYYQRLEAGLDAQRKAGVDLSKMSLIIDRVSREKSAEGIAPVSLRDVLTIATTMRAQLDGSVKPGASVAISGMNIDRDTGNTGLHWDEQARAVSFGYAGRGGPRTIWIENRFSAAYRLDLARRFGLGGVTVAQAAQDETLPDLWNVIARFVEEGRSTLELPYGPYLQPEWLPTEGLIEGDGAKGAVTWHAPDRPGVYTIRLVVSEGTVFVGQELAIRVGDATRAEPTPSGTATGTATPRPGATGTPTQPPGPTSNR